MLTFTTLSQFSIPQGGNKSFNTIPPRYERYHPKDNKPSINNRYLERDIQPWLVRRRGYTLNIGYHCHLKKYLINSLTLQSILLSKDDMITPSSPTRKGRRTRGGRGKGPGRGRGRGGGAAGRGAGRGQHNTNNNNTNDIAVNVSNKEQPQDNTDATPSQKKNVLANTKEKTSTSKSGVAFQVNTAPVDIELDNHHTEKKYGNSPILSNKERRNQQKKERDRIKNESLQKQKENMCNTTKDSSAGAKNPSSKKVSSDASSKDMIRPASKQKSTPQPSSKDGSTLKNIDEHSTSNTIKGANNKKKKAVTISEKDVGTRDSSKDAPPLEEEPEKERKARLLREAREKSALAKEKKKSKKSKKHDKWVKQQEAEKSARAKSWYVFF